MADATATQLAFEFKLYEISGRASATIAGADSSLTIKYLDIQNDNAEVTTLEADKWYKMVVTKGGEALGADPLNLGTLGGTGRGNASLNVDIRNVVVTTP